MFEVPIFRCSPVRPIARRRRPGNRLKLCVEQLERRELLDIGLGSTVGLTNSASSQLVSALYTDLLHREAQPSEIAGWQSALNAGQSLTDLARAFLSSQEYQTDLITDTYATVLKRDAQLQEVNGWLPSMKAGLSKERLTALFLASDEYYGNHGGTAESWLTGLYGDLFQRKPDPTGFFRWREDLQNGTTRETVAFAFVTSPEANTRWVTASYQQFLGRAPDLAGEIGWVSALDAGMPRSELTAGIIGSPEYALIHTASATLTPAPVNPNSPIVQDVPPTVTINGAAASSPEGTSLSLTSTVTSSNAVDMAADIGYAWSVTKDGAAFASATTPSFNFTPVDHGTYVVTVVATAQDKATGTATQTITVTDVPPVVSINGAPTTSPQEAPIDLTSSVQSPSAADTAAGFRYAWNVTQQGSVLTSATTANFSFTPDIPAIYVVTLTVTDTDGATATDSKLITTPTEPLMHRSNLQYVGAFRVPAVPDPLGSGDYSYSFGGTALAFNPANQSLFLVGMPFEQGVSEISIPQSIVNSSNLNNLTTASVLQGPVDVLSKLPNNPLTGSTGSVDIGGLMVDNGQLIGSAYIYYDANASAQVSHFKLSSLNLSTAQVGGLYQVGNLGGGLVAGSMTPIPSEWQAALGAPYLTGLGDIPIISRSSSGPAAFGFDTKALGSGLAPATPYVYYPASTPLGPYTGLANPLESGTSTVRGVVFASGTSSVLFFGNTGTNYEGYGEASTFGDSNHTAKGTHSLNGEYAFQVWAYDANDYAAVTQGKLQPWQVQPYDVWNFTLPNATGADDIGGVVFDANTGRVYVSVMDADTVAPFSSLPLIEVFQLAPGVATPTAPEVGTLAATPSTLAPGAVPQGTSVTLTAGNVYALNNGASVAQVAFYLDSNNDGVLQSDTDQLLGYGTPSTIPNASHNWTLTLSTSGMSLGSHTVFTEALDSNGQLSNAIATTLTIQ